MNDLIDYDGAAELMTALGARMTARTARKYIWGNPATCPLVGTHYQGVRVRRKHVAALAWRIKLEGKRNVPRANRRP